MRVQACACGFLLATACAVSAGERLTIAVSTSQGFAPATATIRVHVTPDANNRGLEVSVDSGEYYRSSWIQLDGTEAPQAIAVEVCPVATIRSAGRSSTALAGRVGSRKRR